MTSVDRETATERQRSGKAARLARPRTAMGEWAASSNRADPVDLLEADAPGRVAELVPIRYGRMVASPFAFYRGAAAIMAADLGEQPSTGLDVQLCGDAHMANFGGFAAPDRRLVFDLNDFDETHPGPFEWDVLRLAASFEIAGRELGLSTRERSASVKRAARSYRQAMRGFSDMTDLDVWYQRLDVDGVVQLLGNEVGGKVVAHLQRTVKKARKKDRFRALARLTEVVDGERRFSSDPPLLVPAEELFDELSVAELNESVRDLVDSYRDTLPYRSRCLLERYSYRHIARKVVGVGSVGSRAWVVLLEGRDTDDPMFLQVKQAEASVLESYTAPTSFENHGERVVAGQSLLQAASDPFLGWDRVVGPDGVTRDYYIRQLWDWKASADIAAMTGVVLSAYAKVCGWALARGHARTGDRIAIGSYLGDSDAFDGALSSFAATYADQNDRDYESLRTAIAAGRVLAQRGV